MKTKNIIASSILAGTMLAGCDQNNSPEITTEKIQATIITKKTGNSVQKILEIESNCGDKEAKIIKSQTKNNSLHIEYSCEKSYEINGVTQIPIPGIPTGAVVPSF